MSLVFRPLVAVLCMTLLMWYFGRQGGPGPGTDPAAPAPAAGRAVPAWDPRAHAQLAVLADCLDNLAYAGQAAAGETVAATGVLRIEDAYRRRCRSQVYGAGFETFSHAYGERARGAVVAILDREESYVAEALADPLVGAADHAALWQVGLQRASADLRELSRRLRDVYAGLVPVPAVSWPVKRFLPGVAGAVREHGSHVQASRSP